MSDGTPPPPPPPYGGGSSGDEPPYGQPYGSPPPSGDPYGPPPPSGDPNSPPPPSGDPYGQPPAYGQPPGYGPPPAYGQPPGYGPPPAYGQPYGAPPGYPAGLPVPPNVAGMGARLGARVLDYLIVSVPLVVLYSVLVLPSITSAANAGTTSPLASGAAAGFNLIAFVVSVGYEVSMIALRGATLGKQIVGIRVVREQDGQLPGWGPALLRWLIPFVGVFACCIGEIVVYLSPLFDSTGRRQGWHDKVAKTFVVSR